MSDGLHRRGGGIWYFGYTGADGHYHERSTRTRVFADAKTRQREFLEEQRAGEIPLTPADMQLKQAAKLWADHRRAIGLAKNTLKIDKVRLKPLLARLGGKKLADIAASIALIKRYQAERSDEVGPRSVNLEMQALVAILKEAKLWRRLENDYKPLRQQKSLAGKEITVEHQLRLLEVARERDAWSVALWASVLAANTGMRGCEIKKLKIGGIQLGERPMVKVSRRGTKTDSGERLIDLNKSALMAIGCLLERYRKICLDLKVEESDEHYLLPANMSKHTKKTDPLCGQRGFNLMLPQESFYTAWKNLKQECFKRFGDARFLSFRFHDWRHTTATRLARNGTRITVAQKQLGHFSPEMTRYYEHVLDSEARTAVDKLDVGGVGPGAVLEAGGQMRLLSMTAGAGK
jgi:integrase